MLERRIKQPKFNEHESELSLDQKVTVLDLYSYGYDLAFVRKGSDENIAVLTLDGTVVVVHEDGEVDNASNIVLR